MSESGVDMEAGLAWLSALVGDDSRARWDALGPIAGVALQRNDIPSLVALIAAGASPWSAMDVSLSADDEASWALLLPAAVKGGEGVNFRSLRATLQRCAERGAPKCFEATAKMLGEETEKFAASGQEADAGHVGSVYDPLRLWEALAKIKSPAARAMARAADAAGYAMDARWPMSGNYEELGSPLRTAIAEDNLVLVDELFLMGAKPKRSALLTAIWHGQYEMLSLVLRTSGVEPECDSGPEKPLEAAIIGANAEAMRILLAAGADPNGMSVSLSRRGGYALSMLGVALEQPAIGQEGKARPEEIFSILLAAGADPSLGERGNTPLDIASHAAGFGNKVQIFEMMKAAIAQRKLVAELESSTLSKAQSNSPAPRL